MQYIRKIKWFILVVIAGAYACTDDSFCLSNQHAIQMSFYTMSSGTEKDTTLTGLSIWGVNRVDSLIYDSLRVHEMYLPANLNYDSTQFVIKQEKLINEEVISESDTIQFRYTRHLNYVSGDCGMTYNLVLDTIFHSTNIIDSVLISYPNVNYGENLENVKIYIEH